MSALHTILVDDVVLVVEHIVSIEPVIETRGGHPVNARRTDGTVGPRVTGSTVTMTPGNAIRFERVRPDELHDLVAEALWGDAGGAPS